MARKGKHKRKLKAKNYSKKKFKNIFCSVCRLCDSKSSPDFCHASIYKSNGPIFISAVYPNLIGAYEYYLSAGKPISSITLEVFSNIFCVTGACTNGTPMHAASCPSHETCYQMFLKQLAQAPAPPEKTTTKRKNKSKKRERKRAVYASYPTYFSRNDEEFKESVRKILHGDIDNEQDKDQELPASDTGSSGGQAEDRES